ncbi:hypothetical protein [Streptomyces sp. NPDC006355]|uniref:hypothetical protein n=1 Tax=Streptomyces sp. NPDC006355 TaxID=3156758 RepID=UPI0033A4922E
MAGRAVYCGDAQCSIADPGGQGIGDGGQGAFDLYGPGSAAQAQHEALVRLGATEVAYVHPGPGPAGCDLCEALQLRPRAGQQDVLQYGMRGRSP